MAFYGNIADRANAYFKFDRIFGSRYEMDAAAAAGTDNVFPGHFALIQYDPSGKIFSGDFYAAYVNPMSRIAYADNLETQPLYYTSGFSVVVSVDASNWEQYWVQYYEGFYTKLTDQSEVVTDGSIIYYTPDSNADKENLAWTGRIVRQKDSDGYTTDKYFICNGGNPSGIAIWSPVTDYRDTGLQYFENYHTDRTYYGSQDFILGYDATVWEKIYVAGKGTFQLIAHLNGMMPGIQLFADPPSSQPSAAYIDTLSTDGLYRIHTPSHWGFRIKEVEGADDGQGGTVYNLSDETIIQRYNTYDSNNQVVSSTNREIHAEIYFNKDGTIKVTRNYDDSTVNEILITPTGESGKVYYDTNGNRITLDTYELAIHLPVIGNIISDFYDLFYGQNRNLDTIWYSAEDARVTTGDITLNYKTRDLDTVAGLVNTFQDRLGQIVYYLPSGTTITNTQAASLNPNYIYAVENGNGYIYYRIGKDYNYTIVPEYSNMGHLSADDYEVNKYYTYSEGTYTLATQPYSNYSSSIDFYRKNISYTATTLTEDEYEPNTYYLDNAGTQIAVETYNYYPANQVFYKKNVSIFKFSPITLIGYTANTYYYQDENNNYIRDSKALVPTYKSIPYYNITSANEAGPYYFNYEYSPNTYFTLEDTHYVLATTSSPDLLTTYYNVSPTAVSDGAKILYQPNRYYYYASYENGQPVGQPIPDSSETAVSGRIYWYIPLSEEETWVYVDGQIIKGNALDVANQVQVQLFSPSQSLESVYIAVTNDGPLYYKPVSELTENELNTAYSYYSLAVTQLTSCFIPYEYYRKDDSTGNYYLQDHWSGNTSMAYYQLINLEPLQHPFYEGSKYYYNNGNIYLIDTAVSMTAGRTYYVGVSLYVWEDSSQRWPYGYEWREQALFVPASVTLATRTEVYKAFEINGIDNGESSINGAILNFNNLASFSDIDTRDTSTLTGAINTTNDLLQSVKTNLIPRRILYVNDFGQICVSSITIDQLENAINN